MKSSRPVPGLDRKSKGPAWKKPTSGSSSEKKAPKDIGARLKAEVDTEVRGMSSGGGGIYAFLGMGTTIFRPYFQDSSDQLSRRVFTHQFGKKHVKCMGDGCALCAVAKEAESKCKSKAWKFRAGESRLMWVCVYRTSYKTDYIRLKEPMVLIFRRKAGDGLLQYLNEFKPEFLAELVNPNIKSAPISLRCESGRDGKLNVSIDPSGRYKLPPLPKDAPSLNDVWIPEDEDPTEEDIYEMVKLMKREIKSQENVEDPDEDDRPSRRRSSRDDDDDEEEDDEDVAPRKRRKPQFTKAR